ncbi:MAG TPA: phosphoribosylanthranilate isomerase [Terriglobales bacterium]|nr:phosphoribosylanthranilate isomerase [Terriglobales bacterium]
MTWVKICGITNLGDAHVAVEAGADALGFVFYEKSPRNIEPEVASKIVAELPSTVEKVGVFVDTPVETAMDILHRVGLTGMQWHLFRAHPLSSADGLKAYSFGSDAPKMYYCMPASWLLEDESRIPALAEDFEHLLDSVPAEARPGVADFFRTFFLDSGTPEQPGGTGKTFDWQEVLPLVESMKKNFNVVIAGGLNPANVPEAVRLLQPWGVDVSSGVEARPGKKDPHKVEAFIRAVRNQQRTA